MAYCSASRLKEEEEGRKEGGVIINNKCPKNTYPNPTSVVKKSKNLKSDYY